MKDDSILAKLTSARFAAVCGILGPLVALTAILVAIGMSASWFTWFDNALSDLGHPYMLGGGGSGGTPGVNLAAPVFNGGLIACGIITLPLALRLILQRDHKSTLGSIGGVLLLVSQFFLISIGVFNEAFGRLHGLVSVGFFVTVLLFGVIYGITMALAPETRWFGIFAFFLALAGAIFWGAYFFDLVPFTGVAIPEIVSVAAVIVWVIPLCLRLYMRGD
ncbi:MAG: DUF998 domain-containing protein [Promethearchaeota archaeon]